MLKGAKKAVSSRFNIKKWIGYDNLKDQAGIIKNMYDDVSPTKERARLKAKKQNLNFEEMMQLHQMTDADVEARIISEKKMFLGYLLFSIVPFAYAIYIFTIGMLLGGIVALLASGLVLAYAFRSRVYIYQLSHRRLNYKAVMKDLFSK
jgi:hypothetical protein